MEGKLFDLTFVLAVPVDHSFFLANFCTTSIASSMSPNFPSRREGFHNHGDKPVQQAPIGHNNKGGAFAANQISFYPENFNGGSSSSGHRQQHDLNQELANAISQITARRVEDGGNGAGAAISPPKTNKLSNSWGSENMAVEEARPAVANMFASQNGHGIETTRPKKMEATQVNRSSSPTALQTGHDVSSDSVVTESDDGRTPSAGAVGSGTAGGNNESQHGGAQPPPGFSNAGNNDLENKPLSFARIASLNLEKAARQATAQTASAAPVGTTLGALGGGQAQTAGLSTTLPLPTGMSADISPTPLQPAATSMTVTSPASAALPLVYLPPTNNPRYFFDLAMEGKRLGRVIIEVQPAVAPKMSQNFGMLVTSERGFGYKGCHFFQAWKNESVICGDWEHNSGRGGRAAIEGGPLFTPDETRLPCIRGAVGMRRMSKKVSNFYKVNEINTGFLALEFEPGGVSVPHYLGQHEHPVHGHLWARGIGPGGAG